MLPDRLSNILADNGPDLLNIGRLMQEAVASSTPGPPLGFAMSKRR
jgi:hypothetical protein